MADFQSKKMCRFEFIKTLSFKFLSVPRRICYAVLMNKKKKNRDATRVVTVNLCWPTLMPNFSQHLRSILWRYQLWFFKRDHTCFKAKCESANFSENFDVLQSKFERKFPEHYIAITHELIDIYYTRPGKCFYITHIFEDRDARLKGIVFLFFSNSLLLPGLLLPMSLSISAILKKLGYHIFLKNVRADTSICEYVFLSVQHLRSPQPTCRKIGVRRLACQFILVVIMQLFRKYCFSNCSNTSSFVAPHMGPSSGVMKEICLKVTLRTKCMSFVNGNFTVTYLSSMLSTIAA
ncbi:hypothetical protein AGLY_011964 [Aphis glycines]|uniref:Uncharacterized protein n=1 Tax=Aphis glycines TaxID=307491 RepID=A0A6G0TB09_APHGL|nr:hypothetical protein AGLY_011964 [Aphis glycines]